MKKTLFTSLNSENTMTPEILELHYPSLMKIIIDNNIIIPKSFNRNTIYMIHGELNNCCIEFRLKDGVIHNTIKNSLFGKLIQPIEMFKLMFQGATFIHNKIEPIHSGGCMKNVTYKREYILT